MTDSGSEADTWDIEKYRVDYESEEHWELRKVSKVTKFFNANNNFLFY